MAIDLSALLAADQGPSDAAVPADQTQVDLSALGFPATGAMVPGTQSVIPLNGTPISDSTTQPPTPSRTSVSTSASAKTKGFDPAMEQTVERTMAPGDARADRSASAAAGNYQNAAIGDTTAAYGAKAAGIDAEAAIKGFVAQARSGLEAQKGTLQEQFAQDTRDAAAVTQQRVTAAEANYQAALAAIPMMDDRLFYHEKSTWGKIGTLAAAFVGGVLDAKGIKNSVLPAIKDQIDGSIAAQMQNIKTKGQVAEGFRTLYDMARADGSDDAAVRDKLQGLLLASFESRAQSELDKYGSELAKAEGMKAMGDLAVEKAAAIGKVRENAFNMYSALAQQHLTLRGQNIQASIASRDAAIKEAELGLKRAAAKGSLGDKLQALAINDVTAGRNGQIVRFANSEDDAKVMKPILLAKGQMDDSMAALREAYQAHGKTATGWASFVDSSEGAVLLSKWQRATMDYAHALGGARGVDAAAVEKRVQDALGSPGFIANVRDKDKFSAVVTDVERDSLQAAQRVTQQYSHEPTSEERAAIQAGLVHGGESSSADTTYGAPRLAELDAMKAGDQTDTIDRAIQRASSPDPTNVLGLASDPRKQLADSAAPESWKQFSAQRGVANGEPRFVPDMDFLAMTLSDDKVDPKIRERAAEALVQIGVTSRNKDQADYALWLADKQGVQYDADAARRMRGTSPDPGQPVAHSLMGPPGQGSLDLTDQNILRIQ